MENLRLELLEVVLVKSIVAIFKQLIKVMSTGADSLAVTAVFMVCQRWRLILENRPFIRLQIKGTLDHVSGWCRLRSGVATLDDLLFFVTYDSSTVCVFDLTSFTQQPHIELGGFVKDPIDIATCDVTRRVYIAEQCRVWYVDWSSLSSSRSTGAAVVDSLSYVVKFIDCVEYEPWSLSTNGRRRQLLVTGSENSLYVYDVDGKLLHRVELSPEVDDDDVRWHRTHHVVQATTDDTYYVCRVGCQQKSPNTRYAEVAEYNSRGQRLRCYYRGTAGASPEQVDDPAYMALIGDGRLVVVDHLARRVFLLKSELKLERMLLTEQQLNEGLQDDSQPARLCYNSRFGWLCVVMWTDGVKVCRIGYTQKCV